MLALYPHDLRDACRRFGRTSRLLGEAGVRVPGILDADCGAGGDSEDGLGWMAVEDLGPATLYDRFRGQPAPWRPLRPYYRAAVEILRRIAALPIEAVASLNPPLDADRLQGELDQTWRTFFEPRGLVRGQGPGRRLDRALAIVCRELAAGPQVPCHRDFMVRNLIPLAASDEAVDPGGAGSARCGEQLGVLDHQDLRLGPRFYDLASLLNDSLFPPLDRVEEILGPPDPGDDEARLGYRRATVQRTLKAVGTFAGHGRHPELIAPSLGRAFETLAELPEGRGLETDLPSLRRRLLDLLD